MVRAAIAEAMAAEVAALCGAADVHGQRDEARFARGGGEDLLVGSAEEFAPDGSGAISAWREQKGVPDMRKSWITLHYGPKARV